MDADFVAAIAATPDDDGPRLTYADWLDEQGDPLGRRRAEFIRLQCALAKLPPDNPARRELALRMEHLRERYQAEWARPLRRWATGWEFRRGLVEEVVCDTATFLGGAAELLALAPVRHLKLVGAASHVHHLAGCPHLGKVAALQLTANYLGDARLRVLLASPHLSRLRAVFLDYNALTDSGAAALAECGALAGLEALSLGHNLIGDEGLRALARSPHLGALAALHLEENPIGDGGARSLLESPLRGRMTRLDLSQRNPREILQRLHGLGFNPLFTEVVGRELLSMEMRQMLREAFGDALGI